MKLKRSEKSASSQTGLMRMAHGGSQVTFLKGLISEYKRETYVAILSLMTGIVIVLVGQTFKDWGKKGLKALAGFLGGRFKRKAFLDTYCHLLILKHKEFRLVGMQVNARRPQLDDIFIPTRVSVPVDSSKSVSHELPRSEETPPSNFMKIRLVELLKMINILSWGELRITASGLVLHRFNQDWWNKGIIFIKFMLGIRIGKITMAEEAIQDLRKLGPLSAILGQGGSGKTALMQYLILIHARSIAGTRIERVQSRRLRLTSRNLLPIFIPLAELAKFLSKKGQNRSIVDYVHDSLPGDLLKVCPKDFFLSYLEAGECLILLDGLDEVFSEVDYKRVRELIQGVVARYPNNRFMVTCRPTGWRDGIGSDFAVGEVKELSKDSVGRFIKGWTKYRYHAPESRQAEEAAADLIERINADERLGKLSTTPLLLSILVTIYDASTLPLPFERSLLYRRCVDTLLERDFAKGLIGDKTGVRTAQKLALLQQIGWALHTGKIGQASGGRGAPRKEVVELIANDLGAIGLSADSAPVLVDYLVYRAGLLVYTDVEFIGFTHMSFQEYFVAEYIRSTDGVQAFLAENNMVHGPWREVFLILASLVTDATPLLSLAFERDPNDPFLKYLKLSSSVIAESVKISDAKLVHVVLQECLTIRSDSDLQLPDPIPKELRDYLISSSTGRLAEYFAVRHYARLGTTHRTTIFSALNAMPSETKYLVLHALKNLELAPEELEQVAALVSDRNRGVFQVAINILDQNHYLPSEQASRDFCSVAINLLNDDSEDFRLLVPFLLRSKEANMKLIGALRRSVSEGVVSNLSAAFVLGYHSDDGVAAFNQIVHGKHVGTEARVVDKVCCAAGALASCRVSKNQLLEFARMSMETKSRFNSARSFAIQLLSFGDPSDVVPVLKWHLRRSQTRFHAIAALKTLGVSVIDDEVTSSLLKSLKLHVRRRFFGSRGAIAIASIIPRLSNLNASTVELLLDLVRHGSSQLARELIRSWDYDTRLEDVELLYKAISSRKSSDPLADGTDLVFVTSLAHARWWDDPCRRCQEILESFLTDKRWYIRSAAAEAWHGTKRPAMSAGIIAQLCDLMADASETGTPEGMSQNTAQDSAFYALICESVSHNFVWKHNLNLDQRDSHRSIS